MSEAKATFIISDIAVNPVGDGVRIDYLWHESGDLVAAKGSLELDDWPSYGEDVKKAIIAAVRTEVQKQRRAASLLNSIGSEFTVDI